jgi:hypothetical protein
MAAIKEVSAVTVASFCGNDKLEYTHFCEILNGVVKSEAFVEVDRQCSSE